MHKSNVGRVVDALALKADEGRDSYDSFGELYVSFDPKISKYGKPPLLWYFKPIHRFKETTWRTETSK